MGPMHCDDLLIIIVIVITIILINNNNPDTLIISAYILTNMDLIILWHKWLVHLN